MSIERIERTELWDKTLAKREDDPYQNERDTLRVAYLSLRENCSHLVSRISAAIPDLTQHEISHLDALWETASLIVGKDFEINPLEGFILGSTFLIHDSALCPEVYTDGLTGLRDTTEWKDTFALLLGNGSESSVTIESQCDFIALRNLHAKRAENLLNFKWVDPDKNEKYLLENAALRKHFSSTIGLIASSHHWDIENLTAKLPNQINTIPPFPINWRVDPVKLACILRCADATHISNERAPDFLYALMKRNHISLSHWKAQNRLSSADIDYTDPKQETLLFTSTIDFKEEDADAWFLVFDALNLIDKELKSCNDLLGIRSHVTTFQIKKVKGIDSPENLSNLIKPLNWKPTSVNVHISNIEDVVKRFGGVSLYGGNLNSQWVTVIRELIQNSRDSIKAREFFDKNYKGKIVVKIVQNGSDIILTIKDNGIGMSERVLTGPFLDFGTSFWSSSLVKSEFPGLRSSQFKSIGKYGIGFYSVFMISNKVNIYTRRWDDGSSQQKELKFKNGFSLRPLLSYNPTKFNSSVSTEIELFLSSNLLDDNCNITISKDSLNSKKYPIDFNTFIALIVAGLDVDIYVSINDSLETLAHKNISDSFDKKKWLKSITIFDYRSGEIAEETIDGYSNRLRYVDDDNKTFGLAAINLEVANIEHTSIETIGGLCKTINGGGDYWGFIDSIAESERRNQSNSRSASYDKLKKWAETQFEIAKTLNLDIAQKTALAGRLHEYGIDAYAYCHVIVTRNRQNYFIDMERIADYCLENELYFPISTYQNWIENNYDISTLESFNLVRTIRYSDYCTLYIEDNKPKDEISLLGCIYRSIVKKGYKPKFDKIENFHKTVFGEKINALVLSVTLP